jgi:hypothetical protein
MSRRFESLFSFSRTARFAGLAALPLLFGAACGSADDAAVTGDDQEIVDIINSRVKNQSIGNCWVYASMGWAEAMHLRATGEELNLSESWLTYWDWYEKIVAAKTATMESITTGGFFSVASRLMTTYGLVDEGVFIPGEATMDRSAAQAQAEAYVNNSLKTGALRKDRSPATVRSELNKAFGLPASTIQGMNAVFGAAAPKALSTSTTIPASVPVRRATDLIVAQKKPGQTLKNVKLSEELPRWREATAPTSASDRRAYVRKVQKAMHDGNPVLIVWNVDWESRDRVAGTFPKMQPAAKIDGVHMTVLEDYQAAYVPNVGVLPAGVNVTDTTILNSALSNQAEVTFFRIKNSWGATADPSGTGNFKGYADLYAGYLFPTDATAPKGIVSFVLPTDYDATVPSGIPADLCNSSKVTVDGDFCASAIGATSTDKRLFTCDTGYSASVRTCAGACTVKGAGKDVCTDAAPPNPCAKATAPGKYCGADLGLPSTDPNATNLYSCQQDTKGTWISPFVACPKGCQINASAPDACKP